MEEMREGWRGWNGKKVEWCGRGAFSAGGVTEKF
jgi:hypothetical protein